MTQTENGSSTPKLVCGFDLGHGETSVATTVALPGDTSIPLQKKIQGEESWVTALSRNESGRLSIGYQATREDLNSELFICFKSNPDNISDVSRQNLTDYFKMILDSLHDNLELNLEDLKFYYVGYPSGWNDHSAKIYKEILEKSTYKNIILVKESRAAMMQVLEMELTAKEMENYLQPTAKDLQSGTLVIDLGSSTIDFTLVRNATEKPLDGGQNLGASLIDRLIFEHNLKNNEENLENIDEINRIFKEKPGLKNTCLLESRKLKEKVFKGMRHSDEVVTLSSRPKVRFFLELSPETLDEIVNTPLPELNGLGWREYYVSLLKDVASQLERSGITRGTIVLTGGASNMIFVRKDCQKIFSNWKLVPDTRPEHCVSRGLARYGRKKIVTDAFREAITPKVSSTVESTVNKNINDLHRLIAEQIAKDVVNDIIFPKIDDYKKGYIKTINDLSESINNKVVSWTKSSTGQSYSIQKATSNWINKSHAEIEKSLELICKEYSFDIKKIRHVKSGDSIGKLVEDLINTEQVADRIGAGNFDTILGTAFWAAIVVLMFTTGPIGWLIGIAATIVAMVGGREVVRNVELPLWARNKIFSDKAINDKKSEFILTIESKVKSQLFFNKDLTEKMKARISNELKTGLEKGINEILLLIT